MELDGGVIGDVGFAGEHVEASHQQFGGDMQGRGFTQIIHIRLEGQAETTDAGPAAKLIFQGSGAGLHLLDHPAALAVIHTTS